MSFNMFSNNQNDDLDPNYIYPRPYIDPMMYINPYSMNGAPVSNNQINPYMNMGGYVTYMNPYMSNPIPTQESMDDNFFGYSDDNDLDMNIGMQGMNPIPNMMMPGMFPMMQGGMMMPGMPMNGIFPMMQGGMMMPNMMMPGMFPMMPNMMMPGMPQINMEEFDEEEM